MCCKIKEWMASKQTVNKVMYAFFVDCICDDTRCNGKASHGNWSCYRVRYLRTPILRSGTPLFSATNNVGTRNSRCLRTYFLLVPHDQAQGIQYTVLLFPVNCETTVFLGALSVTVLSITKDIFVYLVSQFVASGV
jgi:hypothetical protein